MNIEDIKKKIFSLANISAEESYFVFNLIMSGKISDIDISGILIALKSKTETKDEILGADSRTLCRSIRQRGLVDPIYVQNIQDVNEVLRDIIQADDIVITQGAGSVSKLVKILADSNLS